MRNVVGDAWDLITWKDFDNNPMFDVLCLTTNGFVKANGQCVMGRGIALEATHKYPNIQTRLGDLIRTHGNRCFRLYHDTNLNVDIVSFVVKHNWWENADIALIRKSCIEVTEMADKFGWKSILIPRPGCGNGHLSYSDVEPILKELLDDRFAIVNWK